MAFWQSWSRLYRFLFALGCLFVFWALVSFIWRIIATKIRENLEARYQLELTERPPEPTQVQRSRSVNFGVRALDCNETPVEAGIVDSESLRVFSPTSRFSRISSPISNGGRKGSGSTIGSVSETIAVGPNVCRQQSPVPRFKYSPQPVPRDPHLLAPPGWHAMQELRLSTSPDPAGGHDTGRYSPGHPYFGYVGDKKDHGRPVSTSSIDEIVASPAQLQVIANGILVKSGLVSPFPQPDRNRRSVTPGPTSHPNPPKIKEVDLSAPLPPIPEPPPPPPRSMSAPPLKNRRSLLNPVHQYQNLANILEVPSEDPDGIELKDQQGQHSAENTRSLAGPSTTTTSSSGFVIPHPTRAPPPIPFIPRSPPPTADIPTSPVQTLNQDGGLENKGNPNEPHQLQNE
ncbi:hypothetical protein TWF718_000764 [Orbilia javanica]|uniref:Uncharacterized protein n=1 Tax=Orbilia javanica TaxID=47235 RepID=A0AAN8NG75_9PEZI